jgi:hypothetical protein
MTEQQLAAKILQYRRSSSLIVPGTLRADIGPDAMKEALDKRWLEADTDTGFLKLSDNMGTIQKLQALADSQCETCKCCPCECCEKCGKHPCACTKQENMAWRTLTTAHTTRHLHEYTVPPGYGSGQGERGAGTTVQPQTSTAAISRAPEPAIGEDVVIADEGKSYQGKIASKNNDGTFKLSFGPNRPVKDRFYRKEEFQRVQPGDVKVQR